jgi:peptidoglycan/xylan/chitin deacetylase (PgdA/CDA1 family)
MYLPKVYLICFLLVLYCATSDAQTSVIIKLKLASSEKIKVEPASLKYNKHMAFSFTLDDGYRSAFICAYPLLNGGKVSAAIPDEYHSDSGGDGQYSPGLYYSDGCGNRIPFKLAVALNGGIVYDHPDSRARLSWPEVKLLYQSGWDILNHGYHHLTKHGTDFNNEVLQNISVVKEHLGFEMTQFVVPGGEHDPGYEHDYEKDAFASGAYAVASYIGFGPYILVEKPVPLKSMIYARDLLSSYKDSVNLPAVDKQLVRMDSLMNQSKTVWYNAFTHNVGNGNLWSISLIYPEFKYLMTSLATHYGEKGSDQLWMAPWQQVYEYIWLRDHVQTSVSQHGRNVAIKLLLPAIPAGFRYADLSLHIITGSKFTVYQSPLHTSHNGKTKHDLINVSLK